MTREYKSFGSPGEAIQYLADKTQAQLKEQMAQVLSLEVLFTYMMHYLDKAEIIDIQEFATFAETWEASVSKLAKTDNDRELVNAMRANMSRLLSMKPGMTPSLHIIDGGKRE
jgi:hypothetical protein